MISAEQLKEAIPLSKVAAELNIPISGHGNGTCPFCDHKSFSARGDVFYKCYRPACPTNNRSSGFKSGDIFTLLIDSGHATDFRSAHSILRRLYDGGAGRQYEVRTSNLSSIFQAYRRAAVAHPVDYLEKRGVRYATGTYPLGYSPSPTFLQDNGFTWQSILDCGLGTKREGYELFSNRVIAPIYDSANRLIHLQGRSLDAESDLRWLSTTQHQPNVSECVFNIQHLDRWKSEFGFVFLTEGWTDCYSLLELGLPAIATFGIQANLLRHARAFEGLRLIAIYDNDTFDWGHSNQGQYKSWTQMLPELIRLDQHSSVEIHCVIPPARSGIKDVNDWLNYIEWDKDRFLDYCESKMKTLFQTAFEIYSPQPDQFPLIVEAAKSTRRSEDLDQLRNLITQNSDWLEFILNHVRT
ncbi:hypothetical protein ACQ4M3_09285 [Leptolyngbya sp. AN03gr2]|uniref:hypothetical protein n=1 Tax=Leptolyngbya sp. AN03gr2 TaxID=3423364 RepID=UPI003D31A59F